MSYDFGVGISRVFNVTIVHGNVTPWKREYLNKFGIHFFLTNFVNISFIDQK